MATLAYLLKEEAEITQVMVAQKTNIDVMTISQIIDNLEKKLFVIRVASVKDRRAKLIQLTQRGYDKVNTTVPLVENIDKVFFSKLGSNATIFHQMLFTLLESKE